MKGREGWIPLYFTLWKRESRICLHRFIESFELEMTLDSFCFYFCVALYLNSMLFLHVYFLSLLLWDCFGTCFSHTQIFLILETGFSEYTTGEGEKEENMVVPLGLCMGSWNLPAERLKSAQMRPASTWGFLVLSTCQHQGSSSFIWDGNLNQNWGAQTCYRWTSTRQK